MASYFQPLVVLFALVSVGLTASTSRQKRQAFGVNCPQGGGNVEFPGDCSRYYTCDESGQAIEAACPAQLVFNGQSGYCDWPINVPNCQLPSILGGNTQGICDRDPANGNPQNAFIVAHPDLCNAFYTCAISYLHAPCTFCPEGSYFSQEPDNYGCRDIVETGSDRNTLCGGRNFIEHDQKVNRQIDGTCWPFIDRPNPHQELANLILGGGGGFGGGFRG